ncbi:MAG: putative SAM-dependent methyltransferase [Nitrospira sp.]|jgi:SAM-dependent methyltransferase|nr:putative SAM-dependent methyltransferase [Nitrospira sp.]
MVAQDQVISAFAWPFKSLARRMLGERLYQQARVTLLREPGGLGLDWTWGNSLRRIHPIRRDFGWQAGQPINRYYTEKHFLAEYQGDIRGRVLEIADNRYTLQFGGGRVTASDVLGFPGCSGVTIQADLTHADHVPSAIFDCAILTFTLNVIFDVRAALLSLERILKPGGVVLIVVPGISQVSRYDMDKWGEYWRFTSLSIKLLLEEVFQPADVTVKTYGNALSAMASLQGLLSTELSQKELDHWDRDYELVIGVRAVKRSQK